MTPEEAIHWQILHRRREGIEGLVAQAIANGGGDHEAADRPWQNPAGHLGDGDVPEQEAEQAQVDDRVRLVEFPHHEKQQAEAARDREGRDEDRAEPVVLLSAVEHHLQRTQAEREQRKADVVDADALAQPAPALRGDSAAARRGACSPPSPRELDPGWEAPILDRWDVRRAGRRQAGAAARPGAGSGRVASWAQVRAFASRPSRRSAGNVRGLIRPASPPTRVGRGAG